MSEPRTIWSVSSTGWESIPDPLPAIEDFEEALEQTGFSRVPTITLGNYADPIVEVYPHDTNDLWIVCLSDSDRYWRFLVTDLPALVGVLGKLAPVATAGVLPAAFRTAVSLA